MIWHCHLLLLLLILLSFHCRISIVGDTTSATVEIHHVVTIRGITYRHDATTVTHRMTGGSVILGQVTIVVIVVVVIIMTCGGWHVRVE